MKSTHGSVPVKHRVVRLYNQYNTGQLEQSSQEYLESTQQSPLEYFTDTISYETVAGEN